MKKKVLYSLALILLIIVASIPAFRTGIFKGHDIPFHLGRIQAIAEELANGNFPVRYESNAWYGHGYVSTIFYGNIFLYIPALFFGAGMPLWRAYNIYVILVNVATVLIGFYAFRGLFKSEKIGLIATIIYSLSGYRLSNLYVRAAVGEYTAMIFIPLLIYGVYRLLVEKNKNGNVNIIIAATGLIQSHVLTTEICAFLVLVFAVISWKNTIELIKDLLIDLLAIFGINAFFIIPFIDSYSSMKLYINTSLTERSIREDGLYLSQVFGLITKGYGGSSPWSRAEEEYLNIGLPVLLCLALFVVLIVCKKRFINENNKSLYKNSIVLLLFGIIAAWMTTIYFPWDLFVGAGFISKLMSSVQYPWRYILVETVCYIIIGCFAGKIMLEAFPKVKYGFVLTAVSFICLVTTAIFDYDMSCKTTTIYNEEADEDWADKLYLPVETDRTKLNNTEVVVDENGTIIPVLAYKNVHIYDENGTELAWTASENNCIKIGEQINWEHVTVKLVEPVLWKTAEWISILSVLVIVLIQNNGLFKDKKID